MTHGQLVALGYLYSSAALNSLSPNNARAVLAAGCLLGGMDDLCEYAYQACRESITEDTINEWIDFVHGLPPSPDGTASPSEVQRPTVLGPYAAQLRNDVFDFLVVTLPNMLDVRSTTSNGRDTLLRVFSRLPFDLFKNAVESPMFQIGVSILFPHSVSRHHRTLTDGSDDCLLVLWRQPLPSFLCTYTPSLL